jgi:lysophospholipase L1-like esterase
MAPQITCTNCSGTFGPTMFENRNIHNCRFCKITERLRFERNQLLSQIQQGKEERLELKEQLKVANEKIDSQAKELEALRDFATASVGVESSTGAETYSYAAAAALPACTPSSANGHDGFQMVRNNVRPMGREIMPIICQNRFQILTDTPEEEEEEVRLVGDSLISAQLKEFCARAPKSRKRFCIRGGGINDVVDAIDKVANQAPPNTTYVVHVGTNDVQHTQSEELMAKYKRLIKSYKEKSNRVVISGIIPRMEADRRFYNMATSVNRRLANLCSEEGVGFVNTWDNFYYDRSLFAKDGVHLNQVGAARFGRLLNDAVLEYRSKNGGAHARQNT